MGYGPQAAGAAIRLVCNSVRGDWRKRGNWELVCEFFAKKYDGINCPLNSATFKRWCRKGKLENLTEKSEEFISHIGFADFFSPLYDEKYIGRESIIESIDDELRKLGIIVSREDIDRELGELGARDFSSLCRLNDTSLPYYNNGKDVWSVCYNLFMEDLGAEESQNFSARVLREKIYGEEVLFPAINLLENDCPIKFDSLDPSEPSAPMPPFEFIAALRGTGAEVIDNPTFKLLEVDEDSNSLKAGLSSYWRTVYSCDRNFYNLITNYPGDSVSDIKLHEFWNTFEMQEWRSNLQEIAVNRNFKTVECSMGGSVAIVTADYDGGWNLYYMQKANSANGTNHLHVVPSYMFQPVYKTSIQRTKEFKDFHGCAFREFAEELYDYDEIEKRKKKPTLKGVKPEIIRKVPGAKEYLRLQEEGKARFEILGLYLDAFRLRPEIISIIVIEDPAYAGKYLDSACGNWEVEADTLDSIDIFSSQFDQILSGPEGMCAPGAAATILARKFIIENYT